MNPSRIIPSYVAGTPVEAGASSFPLVHPATGATLGQVIEADARIVDAAVSAAKEALEGPWGRMRVEERAELLRKVADGVDARHDEFLRAEIEDTGKPISFARRVDIPRGAANFRTFANLSVAEGGPAYESPTPDGRGALNYAIRRPVGVVGVICPWNLPLLLMTWKVAPALAMGNTVVVKPSEETPQTATRLAEVMRDVGVPAGVYNVVHGFGPGSAGEAIVKHPDVDAITFTGESATGSAIMAACAPRVRAVSFELGGKNPAIIFDDADLEAAVAGTLKSVFSNCGQVCLCSERVYVHERIFDAFVERLARGARAMRIGDPFDDTTAMGPLISSNHRDKVLGFLDQARADGAKILAGGGIPDLDGPFANGFFVQPSIVAGLPETHDFIQKEIFGPVCHVTPFSDEDEVIALANDSDYGLCAALWTENVRRAHRVAARIETGIVWVNTWFLRDLRTPFGGVKLSGIGREGGRHSMDFYSEWKNICIHL